jgi:hypothetical protein
MRKLILVISFLLFSSTAQNAKAAPISFTEDFSNAASLPGPFLEQSAGGTPATFDGAVATFPDLTPAWPPPGRSYLRTIDDDYNTVDFVAEITVTIFNGQFFDGGDGLVWFGMGIGEPNPSFFNGPSVIPCLFMRPSPDNFHSGVVVVNDNGLETHFPTVLAGTGTHRLQMSWDATLQEMTFAIHEDFAGGPFVASISFGPFDGSDNGYNATNSRIFFGGTSGTIYDDLAVQTSPPPPVIVAIDITEAKVHFKDKPNDDKFKIKGEIVLGEGNNGIDPIVEDVIVNVGTSSLVIPAPYSFVEEKAGVFKYKGTINSTDVEMEIKAIDIDTFSFKIDVKGTGLTGTANPVDVELIISDDAGKTSIRLNGILNSKQK